MDWSSSGSRHASGSRRLSRTTRRRTGPAPTGGTDLHTHVVLANKVQGPDKRWRSLDGKTIHAATVTVSELYDGLVADELHRRLHVAWSARGRGADHNEAFEIDGIDDRLLRAFSSRSEQIHEAELDWADDFRAAWGRGPSRLETIRAHQHLTRATQPAKVVHPLTELFTEWGNRARVLTGLEPQDLAGDYSRGLQAHDVGPVTREVLIAQVLDDVSRRRSVWSTRNLGAAAASQWLRATRSVQHLRTGALGSCYL
ncbi:MAG: relaxase domain-containing protein [Actinomycetes bacterium]